MEKVSFQLGMEERWSYHAYSPQNMAAMEVGESIVVSSGPQSQEKMVMKDEELVWEDETGVTETDDQQAGM